MTKKFKQYAASIEQIADRKMSFTISTAAVDRDNDTIDPKGWDLKNFMANPVVLWAHDYSQPPVGKATNVQVTSDGLKADVEFLPMGMNPFADMIHDMVKGGFLNATSVGFAGKDFEKSKDRERGYDFKSQELLEFSIVPVPSNPEALVQRGLKNEQLQRYAKDMRSWSKDVLGEESPKLDDAQFNALATSIAVAMKMPDMKDMEAGAKAEVEKRISESMLRSMKASSMPMASARSMHEDMMNAYDQAVAAQGYMEDCGMTDKALDQAHKEKLQQAHSAAGMAAQHAANAARMAHEYMLQPKSAEVIDVISKDVIDIQPSGEIDWSGITFATEEQAFSFDPAQVADIMIASLREVMHEVVGAQARAAINHMTGRLD